MYHRHIPMLSCQWNTQIAVDGQQCPNIDHGDYHSRGCHIYIGPKELGRRNDMSVPLKTSFRNAIKSILVRISMRGGRPWNYIDILYSDVTMDPLASKITSVSIVYSTVCPGADQRKHQSPASLTFVRGIHWWLVYFPNKGPVTQKVYPLHDVIINKMSSAMINLLP